MLRLKMIFLVLFLISKTLHSYNIAADNDSIKIMHFLETQGRIRSQVSFFGYSFKIFEKNSTLR